MSIFNVLELLCGLALFLYGMNVMGDSLKKSAGNSLKIILGKMTSNPVKGFLLGLCVTAVIQSSSATTVMVVGFVNSGTMTLLQAVGVIMGANVGTAITAWLTGLSGLGATGQNVAGMLQWLKPDAWMPILAVIGICLSMFSKRGKKKDVGAILLGFAVLMTGMDIMSGAVSGLKNSKEFANILLIFENPILGVLAGAVLTAIVQSSSASVGILQSLTVTGAISFGTAIPIILGQNIGTCVTAMLSAIGAKTNGRRAAVVHLLFNVIGVTVILSLFYLIDAFVNFAFVDKTIGMWGVAGVHTVFKFLCVALLGPFYKGLAKLATVIVKDKKEEGDATTLLDERLLDTPSVAVARATDVTCQMAEVSTAALLKSLDLFKNFDVKLADEVRALEDKADQLEDALGSYLVQVSACDLDTKDSRQITKLLHIIGDYERISDHAVNVVESAEELHDKKLTFSAAAQKEISVLSAALREVLIAAEAACIEGNLEVAAKVEPLEQIIDDLMNKIKLGHILRLQKNECTIELGFVLNDLITNLERVSDHCSNIAGCVMEVAQHGAMDMHKYLRGIRRDSEEYRAMVQEYSEKYAL